MPVRRRVGWVRLLRARVHRRLWGAPGVLRWRVRVRPWAHRPCPRLHPPLVPWWVRLAWPVRQRHLHVRRWLGRRALRGARVSSGRRGRGRGRLGLVGSRAPLRRQAGECGSRLQRPRRMPQRAVRLCGRLAQLRLLESCVRERMLGARALRCRWHVHVRARLVWRRLRAAGMLAQLLRSRLV